jgi:hypothetical protein
MADPNENRCFGFPERAELDGVAFVVVKLNVFELIDRHVYKQTWD